MRIKYAKIMKMNEEGFFNLEAKKKIEQNFNFIFQLFLSSAQNIQHLRLLKLMKLVE